MNIKEAKQELLQTIQVYTRKDSNGHYLLPSVRQRPILLIGPNRKNRDNPPDF